MGARDQETPTSGGTSGGSRANPKRSVVGLESLLQQVFEVGTVSKGVQVLVFLHGLRIIVSRIGGLAQQGDGTDGVMIGEGCIAFHGAGRQGVDAGALVHRLGVLGPAGGEGVRRIGRFGVAAVEGKSLKSLQVIVSQEVLVAPFSRLPTRLGEFGGQPAAVEGHSAGRSIPFIDRR